MEQKIDPKLQQPEFISDTTAIKKIRKLKGISQREAGILLGCSISTLKRKEHQNYQLKANELDKMLRAYGCTRDDFVNIRLSKATSISSLKPAIPVKIIETVHLRRSYKKIITKEVQALIELRQRLGITKREACKKCGFDRSAIGAIENGRITLTTKKIEHIIKSYGYKLKDFKAILNSDLDRQKLATTCTEKIRTLSDEKLEMVSNLLKTI